MIRKIAKYSKILLSIVLILSIVAPSYASLSAADGSAFVTKAEFDSALADFNARLTTFEAGINSKIDSQVTSYLDRNGIWQGKLQDLADGGLLKYSETGYNDWYVYEEDINTLYGNMGWDVASTGTEVKNPKVLAEQTPVILINEIQKSGLCMLPLHIRPGDTVDAARQRLNNIGINIGTGAYVSRAAECHAGGGTLSFHSGSASCLFYSVVIGTNSRKNKSFEDLEIKKTITKSLLEVTAMGRNTQNNSNGAMWLTPASADAHYDGVQCALSLSFDDVENDNVLFFVSKGQQLVMKTMIDWFPQSSYVTRLMTNNAYGLSNLNAVKAAVYKKVQGYLAFGFRDIKVY